jgi:hypothetical protein
MGYRLRGEHMAMPPPAPQTATETKLRTSLPDSLLVAGLRASHPTRIPAHSLQVIVFGAMKNIS